MNKTAKRIFPPVRLHSGGFGTRFMRGFIAAAAAMSLFAICGAQAAADFPQRVMSLNLCSDQLLLSLLPPERIASVTYIARFGSDPDLRARATAVGVNYGTTEEVLAQRPDLVVTGDLSTPATRAILKRVGYPIYEMPSADTFDEIREQTLIVGRLVGAEERAAELVAEMDATLAELVRTMPGRKITVVAWDGGGSVPGATSLFNDILTVAGGINLGVGATASLMNSFDIEQLLRARADLIAYGEHDLDAPALRHGTLRHPVIQKLYGDRQITYPENLYNCGMPQSAEAARELRETMIEVLAGAEGIP